MANERALKELRAKADRQRENLAATEELIAAIERLNKETTHAPQTGKQGK